MNDSDRQRAHTDDAAPPRHWTPFRTGWLAILVITVVSRSYTQSSWSWLQDDLLLTSRVPESGLAEYLVQDVAGHVFPGELLLVWVFTTLDPLNYTWAALSLVAFAAAVVVGWGLALRELFGERVHLLIALVVLALSPGMTLVTHWWISAVNVLPMQASMGFCVWFLARYFRRGRRTSDLVWLNVSYAIGLFMWEKSLLVTIPLFFLCLLLGADSTRRGLAVAVRVLWPTALLTVAYLAFYVWAVSGGDDGPGYVQHSRTVGGAASVVARGTTNTVLPALVGGPFGGADNSTNPFPPTPSGVALLLVAVAVVLALVGLSFRRRGGLVLGMTAFYAAVSWGLVFFSDRFPAVGAGLLDVPRYSADLLPVALLTCLFLVTPMLDEAAPLKRPVPPGSRLWISRGLVVYLVALSAVTAVNSGRAWDAIKPDSPKPYMDNLLAEARDLGPATVYDSSPPTWLVNAVFLEEAAHMSAILRPLGLPLTYDEPTGDLLVVNDQGHFAVATIVGVTNAAPGPDGDCGHLVTTGGSVDIPLSAPLFPSVWGVELSYFAASDARVAVRTDDDEVELDLPLTASGTVGHRQLVVSGEVTSITIDGLAGEGVCVTEVKAGTVTPSVVRPPQLEQPAR